MKDLMKKMWMRFFISVLPFTLLLVAGYLVHRNNSGSLLPDGATRPVGILLLFGSVVLGVAVPILSRVRFHNICRKNGISPDSYLSHQSRQMVLVGITGVLAGGAYLLVVAGLYLYGSVLAALYGIYSVLPYEVKTAGELKAYGFTFNAVDSRTTDA